MNWYQKLGPALNNKGRSQSVPTPGQPGPLLIQKMGLWPEVQKLPKIRPPQTQNHQGRLWMTWTWTQPQETASYAETQMMCLYILLARSIGRGYGIPVDWAKAVSGWRLSWKESVTVARTCGGTTMKAEMCSCRRSQLFWDTKNDGQDWPTALHCWGYWLQIYTRELELKPMAKQRLWYCY